MGGGQGKQVAGTGSWVVGKEKELEEKNESQEREEDEDDEEEGR